MEVPPPVLARSSGPRKRRILRQFIHPCPLTGNLVPTRAIEGGLYCWESPGKGWLWSNTLELQDPVVIDGDAEE